MFQQILATIAPATNNRSFVAHVIQTCLSLDDSRLSKDSWVLCCPKCWRLTGTNMTDIRLTQTSLCRVMMNKHSAWVLNPRVLEICVDFLVVASLLDGHNSASWYRFGTIGVEDVPANLQELSTPSGTLKPNVKPYFFETNLFGNKWALTTVSLWAWVVLSFATRVHRNYNLVARVVPHVWPDFGLMFNALDHYRLPILSIKNLPSPTVEIAQPNSRQHGYAPVQID